MRDAPAASPPRAPSVLGMVACLGALFFAGWLAWCAAFQFGGVATEAEVTRTYQQRRQPKRGKSYLTTYGVIRYADQEGRPHTDEIQLRLNETVGSKIPVRYFSSRPHDSRRDDFWDIWGLATIMAGIFALTIGLIWLAERRRGRQTSARNPFQPTPS